MVCAMPKHAKPPEDANQTAAALVREVTGISYEPGEDLIGDPELAERFKAAKNADRFEELARSPLGFIMNLRAFKPGACLVRTR